MQCSHTPVHPCHMLLPQVLEWLFNYDFLSDQHYGHSIAPGLSRIGPKGTLPQLHNLDTVHRSA